MWSRTTITLQLDAKHLSCKQSVRITWIGRRVESFQLRLDNCMSGCFVYLIQNMNPVRCRVSHSVPCASSVSGGDDVLLTVRCVK